MRWKELGREWPNRTLEILTESIPGWTERSDKMPPLFKGRETESVGIVRLKRDGTRAETGFCLWSKRTSPFKSAGASFSRLLAAEVCASALVMLDTSRSEVV